MAKNTPVSDPHRLVIAEHYRKSADLLLPTSQINSELVEIFSQRGRYDLRQIAAVTSWVKSQALQEKRVNPIVAPETRDRFETRELTDFDNQPKNESRKWVVDQFSSLTSRHNRRGDRCLLMPGRNAHDIDMFLGNLDFRPENLVLYIDGKAPDATAEYVRNAREYGIPNRRIGNLEEGLPNEAGEIHHGYLDFFAQYRGEMHRIMQQMPIPADKRGMCFAVNTMASRDDTNTYHSLTRLVENYEVVRGIQDREKALEMLDRLCDPDENPKPEDSVQARKNFLAYELACGLGAAQERNWMCPAELKQLACCEVTEAEYASMNQFQRYEVIWRMRSGCITIANVFNRLFDGVTVGDVYPRNTHAHVYELYGERAMHSKVNETHVFGNMLTNVIEAAINMPHIQDVQQPHYYVSPQGNVPFITNCFTVDTIQERYKTLSDVIEFVLRVAAHLLSRHLNKEEQIRETQLCFSRKKGKTRIQCRYRDTSIGSIGLTDFYEQLYYLQRYTELSKSPIHDRVLKDRSEERMEHLKAILSEPEQVQSDSKSSVDGKRISREQLQRKQKEKRRSRKKLANKQKRRQRRK